MAAKVTIKKKKAKFSPEERRQRREQAAHRRDIRFVFATCGFSRVDAVSDKEFTYRGTTTDFDDAFVTENVLVLVEYTISKEPHLSDHLRKKRTLYDKVVADSAAFVEFLCDRFPPLESILEEYDSDHVEVVILYCSKGDIKSQTKIDVHHARYLDYAYLRYFRLLSGIIRVSAKHELLHFLGIPYAKFGKNALKPRTFSSQVYDGSLLPEAHSNFAAGHKVVSFYVDPEALLSRCYVLRKDGWQDRETLYQRMLVKKKVDSIRKYLREKKRVFVNNVIVTLPDATRIVDDEGHTVDASKLNSTRPVKIQLPNDFNSVGLIDGQHRILSYYEGGPHEAEIAKLRRQQNLLATGIMYPPNTSSADKTRFEANLFLEINANQTNAKSDLKQAIGLILKPFAPESMAREVVNLMNEGTGPLSDQFERYFYDKGKIKTTSVVSYGLRPLLKLSGKDSLYSQWTKAEKIRLLEEVDDELRAEYLAYAARTINGFVRAVKANLPPELWTANPKQPGRMLTTTNVIGFIACLRRAIEEGHSLSPEVLQAKFKGIGSFPFNDYHSSQYNRLGRDLFDRFLSKKPKLATAS